MDARSDSVSLHLLTMCWSDHASRELRVVSVALLVEPGSAEFREERIRVGGF